MRAFDSPGAFATHLRRVSQAIPAAEHEGLKRAAAIVEAEAKASIGQEMADWQALAASTVAEKERLGFTGRISATDPLLRSGELRDSISHEVDGRTAVIGSDSEIALFQELGTSRVSARPFLSGALFRRAHDAVEAIGAAVGNAVAGLPPRRSD